MNTTNPLPERPETISILDAVEALLKHWRMIVVATIVVGVLTAGFLVLTREMPADSPWNLMPDYYKPAAKVLISDGSQTSTLSSLLGQSGLSGLSSLLGGGVQGNTKADLAQALLKENVIVDTLVREFDIPRRIKIKKNPITTARSYVTQHLTSRFDSKTGLMEISFQHVDGQFATAIVNRAVDVLEEEFKSLNLDRSSLKKAYFEESIHSVEKEADKANEALLAFQAKYGIIDLSSQASENVRQISQLQAQIYTKQMDVAIQEKYLPENDARLVRLRNEIDQIKLLINDLMEGASKYSVGPVSAKRLPELSIEYLTRQRNAQLQQSILTLLKQQYESAKLEELNNSRNLQVISKAETPEAKAGPNRRKMLTILVIAAFFITCLVAFLMEYYERAKRDPVEAAKLERIGESFRRRSRRRQAN
jgi:uncharacterized protein involved in exopolysaccharide biosynthesis